MNQIIKKFQEWIRLKQELEEQIKIPRFEEGEIWWCYLGENIGNEECGKGDKFLRPVLVIKKFNHNLFYGLPTTTKIKDNKYYYQTQIKDKQICLMLSQMKTIDAKRLAYRQARMPDSELVVIKKYLTKIIMNKN